MIIFLEYVNAIWSKNDWVCNFQWICLEWKRRSRPSLESLHILMSFRHFKMIFKKLHINTMMICTIKKTSEFWEHFWAFWFQHSNFSICTKYSLIEHLSSILSMVTFSQKLCNFVDLFLYESYTSLLSLQWWRSSKLFHTNDEILLVRRTSQENKSYAQTLPVL